MNRNKTGGIRHRIPPVFCETGALLLPEIAQVEIDRVFGDAQAVRHPDDRVLDVENPLLIEQTDDLLVAAGIFCRRGAVSLFLGGILAYNGRGSGADAVMRRLTQGGES